MSNVIKYAKRGRPKVFIKHELPEGVVKVVRAQCADYTRKERALKKQELPSEVRETYAATNEAIRNALLGIEEGCRDEFLVDIAENKGYDRSQINWLFSRGSYYNRKWKAVYEIAKALKLL